MQKTLVNKEKSTSVIIGNGQNMEKTKTAVKNYHKNWSPNLLLSLKLNGMHRKYEIPKL